MWNKLALYVALYPSPLMWPLAAFVIWRDRTRQAYMSLPLLAFGFCIAPLYWIVPAFVVVAIAGNVLTFAGTIILGVGTLICKIAPSCEIPPAFPDY